MEAILHERAIQRALDTNNKLSDEEYGKNLRILAEADKEADNTLIPNLKNYLVELLNDKNIPIGLEYI